MDCIELARRLKYWRERAELSPSELAKKLGGIHPSSISHWESGRTFPNALRLMRIAAVFGISMRTFWGPTPVLKGRRK
jgi:transcriptional regulator with XRE-family HTH domain